MLAIDEVISTLRAERFALVTRLDAVDTAIESLERAFTAAGDVATTKAVTKAANVKPTAVAKPAELSALRDQLLTVISTSGIGLTLSELRSKTPKVDGADRSAALQALKNEGRIQRIGNTWAKAA